MVKVKAREGESTQQMVARFKRKCTQEGLPRAIKRVMFYEKPSEKRRRKVASRRQPVTR